MMPIIGLSTFARLVVFGSGSVSDSDETWMAFRLVDRWIGWVVGMGALALERPDRRGGLGTGVVVGLGAGLTVGLGAGLTAGLGVGVTLGLRTGAVRRVVLGPIVV